MARRILNRKELRADYEASERQKPDEDEVEETEDEAEEEGDEDEEEAETDEEAGDEEEDEGDEGDEDAPPKKRKPVKPAKAAKPVKAKAKPRTRTPKITRMKVVWGVFNNSNARVATFDYPKRKEADELAAKLTGDKKNTHFVQPIKEPMEEKKEKE